MLMWDQIRVNSVQPEIIHLLGSLNWLILTPLYYDEGWNKWGNLLCHVLHIITVIQGFQHSFNFPG